MIPEDLEPIKLPFAIFFKPQDFGDKIELCSKLKNASEGLLDGESMILPVPANGPPDMPRIQLASRDQSYLLQLSLVRLSLEWNKRTPGRRNWADVTREYFKTLTNILRVFMDGYALPLRFSFSPQLVCTLEGSANEYFTQNLFQPDRIGDMPQSCKIALHDELSVQGRKMNLWTNLATARQRNRPDLDNALVVQFDLNSGGDDPKGVGMEVMVGVLAEAEEVMSSRVNHLLGELLDA